MTKNDEAGKVNRCGAKSRSGGQCQKSPIKGKRRCRLHGGLSTGAPRGNRNAVKHGIYSNRIWPEEEAMIPAIDATIGSVDEEIMLIRVLLMRALQEERDAIEAVGPWKWAAARSGGVTVRHSPSRRQYGAASTSA